jgi:putative ABC transport system permease protein
MIPHLLKLVWNRKKTNLLLMAEIFLAFLVVFAVSATALHLYDRYRDPLGFDYRDVWRIDVAFNTEQRYGQWSQQDAATFRRVLQALDRMQPVVVAAGASTAPYKRSVHISGWQHDNRQVSTELAWVTPEFAEALRLQLVAGRWFEPQDDAVDWTPIVIDRDMARQLVGDGDPVGLRFGEGSAEGEMRVVGVVDEFRRGGELEENGSYTLALAPLTGESSQTLRSILIRVAPGTRADFEEPLLDTVQSIARGWTFSVEQLESARRWDLRQRLAPLAGMALVAVFLLAMVVLGLTGVLWQNVTRRTREIGLRRAAGAHRGRIHRQIVGEVMLTAAIGLAAGSLLAIQLPILGPFAFVPYRIVLPALLLSAGAILLLAAVCGLYPGWSATRIHPAQALHYE